MNVIVSRSVNMSNSKRTKKDIKDDYDLMEVLGTYVLYDIKSKVTIVLKNLFSKRKKEKWSVACFSLSLLRLSCDRFSFGKWFFYEIKLYAMYRAALWHLFPYGWSLVTMSILSHSLSPKEKSSLSEKVFKYSFTKTFSIFVIPKKSITSSFFDQTLVGFKPTTF